MPKKLSADPKVAERIRAAVRRIEAGVPDTPTLRTRAQRGTLRLNFATAAMEAGVKPHLFDRPESLYAAEHEMIASLMAKKGKAVPLRKQLDEARREKREALERLERSRTVNAHLLTRMHKQDLEVRRLQELVDANDEEEEPVIGSGRVSVLPVRQKSAGRGKTGRTRS